KPYPLPLTQISIMPKKKKGNNRLFIILGSIVLLLIVIAVVKGGKGEEGIKVTVENVEKRTIVETVEASGKIFPEKEVKISSDVSGEIIELYVQEGDSVTAGQMLLKIQPDIYASALERAQASANSAKAQLAGSRAQVEQTKAQIAQTEATLENNRKIFERNKPLHAQGVISDADLELSEANFLNSKANLASMKANLASAEETVKSSKFSVKSAEATVKETRQNLNRTTIYAPQSGTVSLLNMEEGERVVGTAQMTGTEIMRIANLQNMEVQVEVSENDVLRVALGDTTDIEVDAYLDRKFTGIVTEIASSANAEALVNLNSDQITNFTVKIRILRSSYADLINPSQKFTFRPGMSATVEIRTETKADVLSVPIQAVTTREDDDESIREDDLLKEMIFVAKGDSAVLIEVKTGIQDDTYIQLVSGVEDGQEIISGPYGAVSKELEDGSTIEKSDKDNVYKKEN
ncbi:MAG: efflux RND transporter periplasmic adaptor subunit, partial [Bacteroidota bacterium]